MSQIKKIHFIPWTGLLLIASIAARFSGLNLSLGGGASIGFIIGAFVVMALEFNRSGDIQLTRFIWDTTLSVCVTVGGTWYISYLVNTGLHFYFVDGMVYLMILLDAWLSPINSFRTSLRNFQVGGSGQ